jgi:hypothetical protein
MLGLSKQGRDEMTHTMKTPFSIAPRRSFGRAIILDAAGEQVASTAKGRDDVEDVARLIVAAPALAAAVEYALSRTVNPEAMEVYETALSLAKPPQ